MAASKAMAVTESNLRKSAMRILGQTLVSSEMHYVMRTLGTRASQQEIDENVLAVRKLPWASIVEPD